VAAVLKIHWFLPTGGDARDVLPGADDPHRRAPSLPYLAQIATACDALGYEGMLTPCGTGCEDAWLATAPLIPLTRRIKFLVAFRPALLSPTLAAQMASTYQRMSGGRLLVNIVTGAEPQELARFGVFDDKETRYERTGEFIEVMRGAWTGEPFDHDGAHVKVVGATTRDVPDPHPRIYFGGASDTAERIAARHVDVYLAWGEPPPMVEERLGRMRKLAAGYERSLDYGIRFHVITRPTSEEAWAAAGALLARMAPEAIAAAQADFAATQSVGQARMASLHGGDASNLEIHPNVWAGVGLVRGGVGTALVGSYDEVADRIEEYAELGFGEFILSGYPHLEEAYWFGEGVMPVLRRRGLLPERDGPSAPVFSFR
jgi:alkanesulfonate monooxygenase